MISLDSVFVLNVPLSLLLYVSTSLLRNRKMYCNLTVVSAINIFAYKLFFNSISPVFDLRPRVCHAATPQEKYSYIRGTHLKTSSCLNYVQLVLFPVLTAFFDHLVVCEYGTDLLCEYDSTAHTCSVGTTVRYRPVWH